MLQHVDRGGPRGVGLQGEVQPLVSAVPLGRTALEANAEAQPPDRQLAEPIQGVRRGDGTPLSVRASRGPPRAPAPPSHRSMAVQDGMHGANRRAVHLGIALPQPLSSLRRLPVRIFLLQPDNRLLDGREAMNEFVNDYVERAAFQPSRRR